MRYSQYIPAETDILNVETALLVFYIPLIFKANIKFFQLFNQFRIFVIGQRFQCRLISALIGSARFQTKIEFQFGYFV